MSSQNKKPNPEKQEQQAPSMEAGDYFFQFMTWLEGNLKPVLGGVGVIALIGLGMYISDEAAYAESVEANGALLQVTQKFNAEGEPIDATVAELEGVISAHPGSSAAERASYLVGVAHFRDGKFNEAKSAFESFSSSHPSSLFNSGAQLGIAASLDSSGQTDAAIAAYKKVISSYGTTHEAGEAKLKLANLLEVSGDLKQSHTYLKELSSDTQSPLFQYAMIRRMQMEEEHPELNPPPVIPEPTTNAVPQIPLIQPQVPGN